MLCTLLLLIAVQVLADAPVTLGLQDAYQGQRECVFSCFVPTEIATNLSCPTAPPMNDCFCRTDLQFQANKHISTCVDVWCSSVSYDVSLATQIYKDYCTSNGYVFKATNTSPTSAPGMLYASTLAKWNAWR